jgi:hypothetical protein
MHPGHLLTYMANDMVLHADATLNGQILANLTEARAILAVVTAIAAGSGGLSQGYIRTALQAMLHLRTPLPGLKF